MLRGLVPHGPLTSMRAIQFIPIPTPSLYGLSRGERPFALSARTLDKPLPPRLKLNDADLTISYLKGSGPGGQKINKTNSAVQITHHPTGLVIKSQETRSRAQNEKIAKLLLADRVEDLHKGGQSRNAIKADRARRKKASKVKKSRRKYRDLEGRVQEGGEEDGEGEEGDEEVVQEMERDDGKYIPKPSSEHAPGRDG